MKVEQFATVIPLLPFDTQTMIIRKQPNLHGIGVCDKIKTYADEHHKECVIIDMAYQDELFLHELRELINYRQGRELSACSISPAIAKASSRNISCSC